jgi:hypothetical protein
MGWVKTVKVLNMRIFTAKTKPFFPLGSFIETRSKHQYLPQVDLNKFYRTDCGKRLQRNQCRKGQNGRGAVRYGWAGYGEV